jgi:hypothetical protein
VIRLLLLLILPSTVHAETLCDYFKSNVKDMYASFCGDQKSRSAGSDTKPAGANSTFSSAFNVSSASIPTEPSSYGVEMIGSFLREHPDQFAPNFSLIKGFNKFGTGISTSGNNTFYGNDIVQRTRGKKILNTFTPLENPKSSFPNLNVGTSFSLFTPKFGPKTILGISLRHNGTTGTVGGGPALMFNWGPFTAGGGFTREKVSNFYPHLTFTQMMASMKLFFFEFEINQLRNLNGPGLDTINIYTGTAYLGRLTLTGAIRKLNTNQDGPFQQPHFAIQYSLSKRITVGFLYNFIPGASSIATQFYLW